MQYAGWGGLVSKRFASRDPETIHREWKLLKQRISVGQALTGTVIAKAPFGAWIDLGVGFPALLEIINIANLTPEQYQADEWCPLGSEVTAFVGHFRDDNHQLYLWQVKPYISST